MLVLLNKDLFKSLSLLLLKNPYEILINLLIKLAYPSFSGTLKEPTQKSPNSLSLEGEEQSNYVMMAMDERNELSEAVRGKAEPHGLPGDLQSPETKLYQIHVISGGLEAGNLCHPTVKRNTNSVGDDPKTTKAEHPGTDRIGFTSEEREKVLVPHHDALVISLTIANCLVKRMSVDSGSSYNIIFQTAYQGLGLGENALIRKATPLIAFSGEISRSTVETILPTYAKGVHLHTNFLVVNCHSSYNGILGRAWIHNMGAIPSTFHQIVKFPTPWALGLLIEIRKPLATATRSL